MREVYFSWWWYYVSQGCECIRRFDAKSDPWYERWHSSNCHRHGLWGEFVLTLEVEKNCVLFFISISEMCRCFCDLIDSALTVLVAVLADAYDILTLLKVASWGGDLLDRGILTVSLAPRDNHEPQVQFALERGIPAILGIISTQRLPFLSNSFDVAHCLRCLIPWTEFGNFLS